MKICIISCMCVECIRLQLSYALVRITMLHTHTHIDRIFRPITRTFNTKKIIEISTCELKIEKWKMIIRTKISSYTIYICIFVDNNNKKFKPKVHKMHKIHKI